jgi:hypothetical protein
MKRCPSCQQTYPDDAPDYCSNDGMRLVDEESASFDPEKTVMSSGLRASVPDSPSPPQPPPQPSAAPPSPQQPQQFQAQSEMPGIKPPTQWSQPGEPSPQQPWNAPSGQGAQQGWPPPAPVQNWGGAPYQQPAANAPYGAPYAHIEQRGRSRALSIAALVTGACAVTIMSLLVLRGDRDFVLTSMLVLGILGILLGVTSLILALQKPARFGGVPLAIAGLATGTAALVYYFTL